MLFKNVTVIGLGGIWSYFWKAAMRTLTYTQNAPQNVSLVDGDQFAFSNLERQDMSEDDEAKMKAFVYEERILREFPRIKPHMIPEFVTKKNIGQIIRPQSIVPFLIDNHRTRKLVCDYVRKNARRLKNVAVITAANDEMQCNAHLHLVLGGKEITKGMDKCHPEIDKPKDKNPGDLSCEERARLPGGGQTSNANMMAASLAHNYFWELLKPVAVLDRKGEPKKDKGGTPVVRAGNRSPKDIDRRLLVKSEVFCDFRHLAVDSTSRAL